MAKRPRLPDHVKRVRSKGREYLYFNTGKKNAAGVDRKRLGKAAIHKLEVKRNKLPKALDG